VPAKTCALRADAFVRMVLEAIESLGPGRSFGA